VQWFAGESPGGLLLLSLFVVVAAIVISRVQPEVTDDDGAVGRRLPVALRL